MKLFFSTATPTMEKTGEVESLGLGELVLPLVICLPGAAENSHALHSKPQERSISPCAKPALM